MTSTAMNPHRCDYSRPLATPHVFTSERAELVHINEKIRLLDNHISQLNTLRAALNRRSCQLRSLFAPINALPVDVLSYIFQQVVSSEEDSDYPDFYLYQERLTPALTLSSVSTHFRRIAFDTPELWKRIPLRISNDRAILKAYSLLQHCIALAPHVDVSVDEELDEQGGSLAIESLLTFDVMQKIRSFDLYESTHASKLWMDTLKDSPLPLLDTLSIGYFQTAGFSFDFGAFNNLTRLQVSAPSELNVPIVVPPSVQYLRVGCMSPGMVISLLYQCPNLVECIVFESNTEELHTGSLFTEPLTLNHLKTLSFVSMEAMETSPSKENLRLPSLESLHFEQDRESKFIQVLSLCHNTSTTLTNLTIHSWSDMLDHTDLYQLCRLPFPKLKQLDITLHRWSPFSSTIRALAMLESEYNDAERPPFPSLRSITLSCGIKVVPHVLLNLLKKWRIGQTFYFHIRFFSYPRTSGDWSPKLREELASIVGERRVEVTWDDIKLLQQT